MTFNVKSFTDGNWIIWHDKKMIDTELALRENVSWIDGHNLIHSVFHGDQTPEKIHHTFRELHELCNEMASDGHPLLMLWDIRDIQAFPTESRLIALNARTHLPFWQLAIVASDDKAHVATAVSQHLTAMSGRKAETKYFASLLDATKWLDTIAEGYKRTITEWPVLPS